jgi:hypothetical protein
MAEQGMAGNPRLVVAAGGHGLVGSSFERGEEVAYPLESAHTVIGGEPGQQIFLDGLEAEHAVVDWIADGDEFVFRPLVSDDSATIDDKPIMTGLHNGDRIELGAWKLVFQRDEPADHTRKAGARQGGDYAGGGRHRAGGHEAELG